MTIKQEFMRSWRFVSRPAESFEAVTGAQSYWEIGRYYLVLNVVLAVLTPITVFLGFPCDIVHAGTNAQMGAYLYSPFLENITGLSRYLWIGLITYAGNVLKFPILGLMFHGFAMVLKGSGSLVDSFKVSVYAAAPVLLLGWIPYFGLISGLWVGYLYVLGFWKLHETGLGPTIALVNFMIGVQIVWAFVFGWILSPV